MKRHILLILSGLLCSGLFSQVYTPDWESLDARKTPDWYSNARFGISVHYGLFSVPSYRAFRKDENGNISKADNQVEWYVPDVMYDPYKKDLFHQNAYGRNFSYFDFAPFFRAELYNPDEWMKLFRNAGASYVVLTAKQADGYCLWPTRDKYFEGFNTFSKGPGKDLVGEFVEKARLNGLRTGLYYSFTEFWSTRTNSWPGDPALRTGFYVPENIWQTYHIPEDEYMDHLHFQVKELVSNYRPDILWIDNDRDYSSSELGSEELLAWIYNEAPNRDRIVVNNRWGNDTGGRHGGFYTAGFGQEKEDLTTNRIWELSAPLTYSNAYNRAESLNDYKSADDLIEMLAKTTAKGGNFLLNIGPESGGNIPLITRERLIKIGKWMESNREAINGTRPFIPDTSYWVINPKAGEDILFTTAEDYIYVFLCDWKIDAVSLKQFNIGKYSNALHLGSKKVVDIDFKKDGVVLKLPPNRNERVSVVRIQDVREKPGKKE